MNTTRRDESKRQFYAEVKDILEKKHRESSWYMMELMGVDGKEEADRKKAFRRKELVSRRHSIMITEKLSFYIVWIIIILMNRHLR